MMVLRLKPVWPLIPQPYKYVVKSIDGIHAFVECPFFHYPSGHWHREHSRQRNIPAPLALTAAQCSDPHNVELHYSIEVRPSDDDDYQPFVTPETVVNDLKAVQS